MISRTHAGGSKSLSICRNRMFWCPLRLGSKGAMATGIRKPSQLAINTTMPKPKVYGDDSLWRVTRPKGCLRPRLGDGKELCKIPDRLLPPRRESRGEPEFFAHRGWGLIEVQLVVPKSIGCG